MISNSEKILVLAPHTDDGELGCGGTIARLASEGKQVYYAAFSTAEESVPEGFPRDILKREVRKATACLGIPEDNLFIYEYEVRKLNYRRQDILEDLVTIRRNINPDLVLMPSLGDIHQDHTTVASEGLRAFKYNTLLGYELIWNNLNFDAACFVRLELDHVETKANALSSYASQAGRPYMNSEYIFSHARTRGIQIGTEFAECFEVVRLVL